MPRSQAKRKADELLLSADGDGWVDKAEVLSLMADWVMPGVANRRVKAMRDWQGVTNPRIQGTTIVGQRHVAKNTMRNALRYTWEESECGTKVRHKDHNSKASGPDPEMFVVPDLEELRGLGRLLTSSDWEKAAVVATFVELKDGRGGDKKSATAKIKVKSDFDLTTYEFAELGIVGLKSKNSVVRYAKAWMDEVGTRPQPGQPIAVPTKPLPKHNPTPNNMKRKKTWHECLAESNDLDEVVSLLQKNKGDLADWRQIKHQPEKKRDRKRNYAQGLATVHHMEKRRTS